MRYPETFMQSVRQRLVAPLVLFALTVGVHWKILLTRQYAPFDSPDLAYQVAPWFQVQASELHKHHWPLLWDPYILGGHPLLGQGQPGVVFPLNWALFAAPLRRGFLREAALNWYVALIRYIAALAMYALCRDLGRSRIASIFAGAAFAFSGYIGLTTWPQMLNGAILAPLVLLFSLRALRGEKPLWSAAISGAWLGLSWLSGHHQIPIFVTLAVSAIWIFHIARPQPRRERIERAGLFAVLVAVMIMGGAAQTFPAYSYGHDVMRWVGATSPVEWNNVVPYSVHDMFALEPISVLGILMEGIYTNSNPFIGITVFIVAISGIAMAWKNGVVKILCGVAIGGLLFAFSSHTILHGIIYSLVPMVEKARDPAMAIFVFHLGVCALSAFGLDAVLDPAAARSDWFRRAMIACGGVAILLWLFLIVVYGFNAKPGIRTSSLALTALAAVLIAAILGALRRSSTGETSAMPPRNAAVLLLCVMMMEIGGMPLRDLSNSDLGQKFWSTLSRDRNLAGYLKSRPGPFRVDVNSDDIPYNFGDWYGLEGYWGYLASAPPALLRIMNEPRARALLGVRYLVAKKPDRGAGRALASDDATGIKVFEMPAPMPRTWVVHSATQVSNPDETWRALTSPSLDLAQSTFMLGAIPAPMESCTGDAAQVMREEPQFVAIEANLNCRGMVIVSDSFSKDWTATVDGKRAPLYAAYSIIDGVAVDRGAHRIELRYRPVSFYLGASLSIASWLMIAAMWFWNRRRRSPAALADA
jgi:hypothetical protein